jgi:hypothetical protein
MDLARNNRRDFPKFFQITFDAIGRTYELGQLNIDPDTVWIATTVGASATELTTTDYHLDNRNGILRLASTPSANTKIMILKLGVSFPNYRPWKSSLAKTI